jgi:4-hydroxyphenylacetate 3-monooxygenase
MRTGAVFIYRRVDLVNAQFHETPSHPLANFQSLVRFAVKCRFLAGLALRLAEVQRAEGHPTTQSALGGDVAALAAMFEAIVEAAARFPLVSEGVARPGPAFVYAGMSLQPRLIVDLMRALREQPAAPSRPCRRRRRRSPVPRHGPTPSATTSRRRRRPGSA